MRTTLFVAGFNARIRARDLAYEFERYGRLVRCDIPAPKSFTAKIYAFVEFENPLDAEDAFNEMHGRRIGGCTISVQWARNAPAASWRLGGPSNTALTLQAAAAAEATDEERIGGSGAESYPSGPPPAILQPTVQQEHHPRIPYHQQYHRSFSHSSSSHRRSLSPISRGRSPPHYSNHQPYYRPRRYSDSKSRSPIPTHRHSTGSSTHTTSIPYSNGHNNAPKQPPYYNPNSPPPSSIDSTLINKRRSISPSRHYYSPPLI